MRNRNRGQGFLADLSREWEAAAKEAQSESTRVVLLRLGMVLGKGAALEKMLPPFKLGFGGPMGSGSQWWPWIAISDVVGVVDHVLEHRGIRGPVNLVAPEAVTSKGFARALGEYLGRPAIVPAPAFAIKLALGEMAEALPAVIDEGDTIGPREHRLPIQGSNPRRGVPADPRVTRRGAITLETQRAQRTTKVPQSIAILRGPSLPERFTTSCIVPRAPRHLFETQRPQSAQRFAAKMIA